MARCKVWALLALASCAAPTRRECELEPPQVVARSSGLAFDGVAVAGHTYAWSDDSGLYVQGDARVRLGARCRGGIDAATFHGEVIVACSRPAADGGEVVVYRAGVPTLAGNAGRDGHGVALAVLKDEIYLAFHEGALGDHAIWLAKLGTAPTRISHEGAAAREPSLVAHQGHLYAAFAELKLQGPPASTLFVSRDGSHAKQIVNPRAFSPTPKLTTDARGLVLGYRDRDRDGARAELRVVRLNQDGQLAGTPSVVGRANDAGEPNLYGCGDLIAALLPREYGGERYVGIHPLDDALSALGSGHQLYESGRDFVLASGSCDAHGLQLFAADRAAPSKPGVEAIALRFTCQ
ncbi:MAG TPA: hypothetical protein VI299_11290 [Polyangiales bacterium]